MNLMDRPVRQMPVITIGLVWHSVNSDNLGIGALTASQISIIEELAQELRVDVRFMLICWQDGRHAYIKHPNLIVVPIRAKHLFMRHGGLRSLAEQCDFVLDISTGDGFTDLYGTKRFALSAVAKLAVILSSTRYILSPQTVGPFRRRWTRPIVRALLRRAAAVVTRDDLTTDFLAELGVSANVAQSTDVAFRLDYQLPGRREGDQVRVGLNVSGLLFNGGYTGKNMLG